MHKQQLETAMKPVSRAAGLARLEAISLELFEGIDTPRSLAAHILLKYGEYAQLCSLDIDPSAYLDHSRFADDYLATKFLSKFPGFKHPDLDPEAAAWNSFLEYEAMCKDTNRLFLSLREDPSLWDPSMKAVLQLSRRKIARVLGEADLSSIAQDFGWGPGATSVSKGILTSAYVKYAQRLDVTYSALAMGQCCVNSTPAWVNCQLQTDEFPSIGASLLENAFNVIRGNEIVFVPKTAKTHRVIAKEPHVNSYLQRGFGRYIRKRLKRYAGVDLNDQQRNQQLALLGSLTGSLATIDLSGASDTISLELVRYLLPESWFSLLSQLRSAQGLSPDGTWMLYHKFSSMGNGFTFELESLIFWALCKSCMDVNGIFGDIHVYGDDIIVPSEIYEKVRAVISFCGFRVNEKKSFSSGPFRESCGKDYFSGQLVRPIFLKEDLTNVESLYRLANSLRRYARRGHSYGCDGRFRQSWERCVSFIPVDFRYKIPEGFGDVGLAANFDEAVPRLLRPRRDEAGWEGFFFTALTRVPVKRHMSDRHAGYTATLSASARIPETVATAGPLRDSAIAFAGMRGTSSLLGKHTLRDMTRAKVARMHTRGWYDFGPWI